MQLLALIQFCKVEVACKADGQMHHNAKN